MSQLERLYRIEHLLLNSAPVSTQHLLATLEVSLATLKRDLAYLRDRLHVPLAFDRFQGGYILEHAKAGGRHAMPGLWFSADEVRALLTMHKLLSDLDAGGLLGPHIEPLLERIKTLLASELGDVEQVMSRIGLQLAGQHRTVDPQVFEKVSTALLLGQRLSLRYRSRYSDQTDKREISPQRLTYYRDNWYLAAYCHKRHALRVFSLDGMAELVIRDEKSCPMPIETLKLVLERGYGIFSGGPLKKAVLEFDAASARWVQDQHWHRDQRMQNMRDGRLRVHVPYQNDTELAVDILSWGENVRVITPRSLRLVVAARLRKACSQYKSDVL